MATREAVALMRDSALRRLMDATNAISAQVGTEPPVLPERNRDPDYQHAAELTAVAVWVEGVALALTPQLALEGSTDGNPRKPQAASSRRHR